MSRKGGEMAKTGAESRIFGLHAAGIEDALKGLEKRPAWVRK
jgi:hypothetical protein